MSGFPVAVAWDRPTLDAGGNALTDLAGFRVYEGASPGEFTSVTDAGNVTELTLDSLEPGTHYLAVAAYDDVGNESDLSEELVVTIMDSGKYFVVSGDP